MLKSLLVLAVLVGCASAAYQWYLLADDDKNGMTNAMPMTKKLDAPQSLKPTILMAVAVTIPPSLQTCTDVVFDLPLWRRLSGNASLVRAPSGLNVFEWRTTAPTLSWAYANTQKSAFWTVTAGPQPNMTWQPDRAYGVYRYRHTFPTNTSGGSTTWYGFLFDQPLAAANNSVYWLGNGPGSTFGFRYVDIYGTWAGGGQGVSQTTFQTSPTATTIYALNGSITNVSLTVFMRCQPIVGGQQPPTSFVQLPPTTWGPAGTIDPGAPTPLPAPMPAPAPQPSVNTTTPTPLSVGTRPPPPMPSVPLPPSVASTPVVIVVTTPSSSTSNETGAITPSSRVDGVNQALLIAVIVLASLIGLVAVSVVVVLLIRRHRRSKQSKPIQSYANLAVAETRTEDPDEYEDAIPLDIVEKESGLQDLESGSTGEPSPDGMHPVPLHMESMPVGLHEVDRPSSPQLVVNVAPAPETKEKRTKRKDKK